MTFPRSLSHDVRLIIHDNHHVIPQKINLNLMLISINNEYEKNLDYLEFVVIKVQKFTI